MEDGLRECPFSTCGSSDAAWQHDRNKGVYFITCGSCDASGPMRKTKEEAVKAWNTRATNKDSRCKCDMRTSLVGDGCRYCNLQYYIDMLEEQIKESKALLDAGAAVTQNGAVYVNPEQMRHHAEEYEACMMAMDKAGVPQHDENGMIFSIWGRACWMARNLTNI